MTRLFRCVSVINDNLVNCGFFHIGLAVTVIVWYDGDSKSQGVTQMYCPNCNIPRPNDTKFCRQCGTELVAPPKQKKGKLWPPIAFMVAMVVAGCVLFALTRPEKSSPSATPWFAVEDGTLSFDPYLYTGEAVLEIPDTVDGQTVTTLSEGCFEDCDTLEMVILPDTLETIGSKAFKDCDNLRGIKLTEKVNAIGNQAFYSCSSLEAIYIPDSVQNIGGRAFSGCGKLEHVFFVGNSQDWEALYPDSITGDTQIYQVSGPDADSYKPL